MTEPAAITTPHDRDALIHEIALTNQFTVPWDTLRKALLEKLDIVLASKELVYTEAIITNPITTTLAAEILSIPNSASLSAVPTVSTTDVPDETKHGQEGESENDSGASSSENSTATEASSKDGDQVTSDTPDSTISPPSPPPSISTTTTTSATDTPTTADDSKDDDSKIEIIPPTVSSNGPATPPRMVPVSKETLILETPEGYHARIIELLSNFASAPFTIQRLCELLDKPTEHHSSLIKYLRAVEKVLMITSSIYNFPDRCRSGPSDLDGDATSTQNLTYAADGSSDRLFSLITTQNVSEAEEQSDDNKVSEGQKELLASSQETEQEKVHEQGQGQEQEQKGSGEMEVETSLVDTADMDVDTNENGMDVDVDVERVY
ncbi:protein phosphatase 4, regulatory subunit 2 [Podila epigama]|nr:protein phosphatase 4, regulatory subunit 2 [Podila epigama]